MDIFAKRLQERAQQLGISNAEAARRSGLEERRYAHYAAGRREPDLSTLVKIAKALKTSPDWLLGFTIDDAENPGRIELGNRLLNATSAMSNSELEFFTVQAEAVVAIKEKQVLRP